MQFIVDMKAR